MRPTSAALTGDIELRQRPAFPRHRAVRVGQRAQEAIENRKVKLARHDSGLFYGDSDLLLMVPTFGKLAGGVEPVRGLFLARPAHWKHRPSKRIDQPMILRAVTRRRFHPRNQFVPAQLAVCADAFGVEVIDQRDQLVRRQRLRVFRLVPVPGRGQFADLGVEQMRRHILDFPFRRESLLFPILWRKRPKKLDQHPFELREKIRGEDRLQRPAIAIHACYLILLTPNSTTSFLPQLPLLRESRLQRRSYPRPRGAAGALPASSGPPREFRWHGR